MIDAFIRVQIASAFSTIFGINIWLIKKKMFSFDPSKPILSWSLSSIYALCFVVAEGYFIVFASELVTWIATGHGY